MGGVNLVSQSLSWARLTPKVYDETVTPAERRIANAAVAAGPWENHDEIVIAVADLWDLDTMEVEAVLRRLRVRQVLNCVSTAMDMNQSAASVRYQRGIEWTDKE